jgi:hypothetical protein
MKKFAIICHGRSGSNFLVTELKEHPDIECGWEIYLPQEINKLHLFGAVLENRQENPKEYIDYVYKIVNVHNKPIVGSKLLHPTVPLKTLEKLITEPDISFIFLYRKNILESVVSYFMAKKTNQWIIEGDAQPIKPEPFIIPLNEIEYGILERIQFIKHMKNVMKNHLEVTYEELINVDTINRICLFLGVPLVDKLHNCIKKQANEKTYNLIQNKLEIEEKYGKIYGYLGKSSLDDLNHIEYWKQ